MVQFTRNFDFFDKKKPGFLKPFLTNRWRHFERRFCGWNNCLTLNYCFFQCSKNHGSPTHVTRLKVAPKMADPISFKTQDSSLKYHVENSRKISGLLSSFVICRGVARLFKMRGRQGGWEGDWPGLKMAALHSPLYNVSSRLGGSRGMGFKVRGLKPPSPGPLCRRPCSVDSPHILRGGSLHRQGKGL